MNDDNKTDNKNVPNADLDIQGVPDIREETPETLKALRDSIAEAAKREAQEADVNFWASLTPAEILERYHVTQEEFDRTFPIDYKPLGKKLEEMTSEERQQRIAETRERLRKMVKATNKDKTPMPNEQALNEKYVREQEEMQREMPLTMQALISHFTNKEDGPIQITHEMLADALQRNGDDKTINNMVASAIQELHRRYMQDQATKAKETKRLMTDLLSFDAKKAKQLWLDNIKRDSNIHNILGTIHESANKGNSETTINYVSTYDQLKLGELGFDLKRTGTNGRAGEYIVSWSA